MNFNDLADDPEDAQHSPAERAAAASRSTWVSVGVNIVLTVAQISAGILSRSQGLIADGIHSLSDLIADFVVLLLAERSGVVDEGGWLPRNVPPVAGWPS